MDLTSTEIWISFSSFISGSALQQQICWAMTYLSEWDWELLHTHIHTHIYIYICIMYTHKYTQINKHVIGYAYMQSHNYILFIITYLFLIFSTWASFLISYQDNITLILYFLSLFSRYFQSFFSFISFF